MVYIECDRCDGRSTVISPTEGEEEGQPAADAGEDEEDEEEGLPPFFS